jgi:hypothetical protein
MCGIALTWRSSGFDIFLVATSFMKWSIQTWGMFQYSGYSSLLSS